MRREGLEPGSSAWKAVGLTLSYARNETGRRGEFRNHRPQRCKRGVLPLNYSPLKNGGPGRARSGNSLVMSQTLYRLSYRPAMVAPVGFEPTNRSRMKGVHFPDFATEPKLAGRSGFEPLPPESKSDVLPLDERPIMTPREGLEPSNRRSRIPLPYPVWRPGFEICCRFLPYRRVGRWPGLFPGNVTAELSCRLVFLA